MLILEEQLAKLPLDDFSKLVVQAHYGSSPMRKARFG